MFLVGSSTLAGEVKLARDTMLFLLDLGSAVVACCVGSSGCAAGGRRSLLELVCDRLKHVGSGFRFTNRSQILRRFSPCLAHRAKKGNNEEQLK